MLILNNITINRGTQTVIQNLDLSFEMGKIYTILGPNGTGKSSLLKAIFGEISSQGQITYCTQSLQHTYLQEWQKPIGYMPQDTAVAASLNALEVILLGQMDKLGMHVSDEMLTAAATLMHQLNIAHLAQRDITQLSGGQRQLVMFAQVLMKQPKILMLDEPVSALDMHHQLNLLEHVQHYTREHQTITLMVLHDLSLAGQFSDSLILLGNGQLQAQGSPTDVLKANLINELYHIEVEILSDSLGRPVIRPLRSKQHFHQ